VAVETTGINQRHSLVTDFYGVVVIRDHCGQDPTVATVATVMD
jgi:hypothetical protein